MGAQDPENKTTEGTEGQEGAEGTEPNADGETTEGTEGQEGNGEGGNGGEGEGGKPGATVNRHKYERGLAAKDKRIAELQAQIDEAAKTKQGRNDLQKFDYQSDRHCAKTRPPS